MYMEGVFRRGMSSPVRAGQPGVMVRAGLPMQLTGTGTTVRRSVVLILQDASKPRSTLAPDWSPKGLCEPR